MEQREQAMAKRHARREQDLQEHTKTLLLLKVGRGNHPLKWQKSGQIVEVLPYDQYKVKIDGTGRCSLRNRKFLRPITPFSDLAKRASSHETDKDQAVPTVRRSERIGNALRKLEVNGLTLKELRRGEA